MALAATDVIVVRNAVRPSQMQGSSCNQIHQWLSMVRPQHPQLLLHMETCRVKYVGPLGQLFIISRQWQDSSCSACLPALMNFGQCCSLSSKAILMLCHTVVRTKTPPFMLPGMLSQPRQPMLLADQLLAEPKLQSRLLSD